MKIIADGDSWFDYPRILLTGGGVINHLERLLGQSIPNLAHHGDGTQNMLSLKQRKELEYQLKFADILLFSGGGNDICGEQFCVWLNDNTDDDVEKAIHWPRLNAALDLTMAVFDDLRQIRDAVNPECYIVTHGYDFPIPSDKGVCGNGPWLKPSLDYCGWRDKFQQSHIAALVLKAFDTRLTNWDCPRHLHVPTQGTLIPIDWQNEIHPNRTGYAKIAKKFAATIKPLLQT